MWKVGICWVIAYFFYKNDSWLFWFFIAFSYYFWWEDDNKAAKAKQLAEEEEEERLSKERKYREIEEFKTQRQVLLNQHRAEKLRQEQAAKKQEEEERLRKSKLKEQEAQRKKEEADKKKKEDKQKLDETARLEELRLKKEEAAKKKQEEKQKLDETARLEELRLKKEEAKRKKDEEKQKLDETARLEEFRLKKEEAKRKKEQDKQKLDETARLEELRLKKEEAARRKEEEKKKLDESARLEELRLKNSGLKIKVAKNTPFFFHSLKGEKSAIILIKKPDSFVGIPVYVPRGFVDGMNPQDVARLDADYIIKPLKFKDGEYRVTSEGETIMQLVIEEEKINLDLLEFETEFSRRIETLVLNSPNGFTFNHIKNVNSSFTNSYDVDERDRLHRELKSGVEIIQTEKHLNIYISSYGNMHQAKLMEAYEAIGDLSNIIGGNKIQIIDYGCGQGIGSILFMDFLKSSFSEVKNYEISKITLIEPSRIAIKRANMLVNSSLKSHGIEPNIFVSNKMLNEVSTEELENKHAHVKFHILSNILDVESIDVHDLFQKLDRSISGDNFFICVSPKFRKMGVHPRNVKLDTFLSLFQNRHTVQLLSQRETDIRHWTRYERIFRINKTSSQY